MRKSLRRGGPRAAPGNEVALVFHHIIINPNIVRWSGMGYGLVRFT
jgi:hypothetical protein